MESASSELSQDIELLFQAALRYIEHANLGGLRSVLQNYPLLSRARVGRGGLIHAAAETGQVELVRIVLDAGADPNMPEGSLIEDDDNETYQPGYLLLQYAAKEGFEEMVALLLERGAEPRATDYWGGTALHAARTVRIAEALLKAGAYPNAQCELTNYSDTFSWYSVGPPLHVAARCADVERLRTLIRYGASVNQRDFLTGRTALHFAVDTGSVEAVKILLKLGASPNHLDYEPFYDARWYTPLHRAAQKGNGPIVKALLKAGADVSPQGGPDGKTASELALDGGHSAVVAMLAGAVTDKRRSPGIRTRRS